MAHAREILRAVGVYPKSPTFIGTDNKANALIGSRQGTPGRMRHCMRRYATFLQRIDRRDERVVQPDDVLDLPHRAILHHAHRPQLESRGASRALR